ncbi:MAG TPA: twin-arginine translocation signal domain-containing protein [Pyrinomonadaceae bacterium]|nr:twin-arginine translocation signal domain-containing protein [Pyrinomonadaceae bacterium]
MSIARRNFLKSATMTTLAAGLAIVSAQGLLGQQHTRSGMKTGGDSADFPIPLEAQEKESIHFRSSTFTPYVGDIFQIPNARGEMITLRLVRVSDYRVKRETQLATKSTRLTESFSLTFSATEKLPQFTSIHKMSHPALGEFDLFLTSRKTDDGKTIYEAVFNHIQ